MVKREIYLKKIKPFVGKRIIKVIVGQRRVGKSYLLKLISDEIKKKYPNSNFIFINKELYSFDEIKDYRDLIDYVEQNKVDGKKNFLFIDEVQEISQFEKSLRDLILRESFDIYVSGSNSTLLSGELATLLAGRYIKIPVHSLSYREFLKFHGFKRLRGSLNKYLKYGGMPYLKNLKLDDEVVFDYLSNIYDSIVLKDVVKRYGVRNVNFLNTLVKFLSDNIGNLFSAKRIADFLKSQRVNISVNTIMNYLTFLENAFFIYTARRVDLSGKKVFEINQKFYFEDVGIRNSLVGFKAKHINGIIENVIFKHLLISGYRVFIGEIYKNEIDFVAEKRDERIYVQSCYLLSDKKVWEREFGNLLKIKDNFRKIVVSMDETPFEGYMGIEYMKLEDFLYEFSG